MSLRKTNFRRFWLLNILFVTKLVSCEVDFEAESATQEYIICRQCGADIADAYYLHNKLSPFSKVHSNQSLFGKTGLKVQDLVNPLGIKFQIINTSKAHCVGEGQWHNAHSWYPGYSWRHCVCPKCHSHLGWLFETNEKATGDRVKPSKDAFYAIILDNVLSEKLVNSLLIIPHSHRA